MAILQENLIELELPELVHTTTDLKMASITPWTSPPKWVNGGWSLANTIERSMLSDNVSYHVLYRSNSFKLEG